jgi:hypothetical protein
VHHPQWGSSAEFGRRVAAPSLHSIIFHLQALALGCTQYAVIASHHAMNSSGRQLPTRVSNACDRCRRNKSRCDPYRPCSLCTRANVECVASHGEGQARPTKRKRTRGPSSTEGPLPEPSQSSENLTQPIPSSEENTTIPTSRNDNMEATRESHQEAESRRPSVSGAQIDSAMGIAQKVSLLTPFL